MWLQGTHCSPNGDCDCTCTGQRGSFKKWFITCLAVDLEGYPPRPSPLPTPLNFNQPRCSCLPGMPQGASSPTSGCSAGALTWSWSTWPRVSTQVDARLDWQGPEFYVWRCGRASPRKLHLGSQGSVPGMSSTHCATWLARCDADGPKPPAPLSHADTHGRGAGDMDGDSRVKAASHICHLHGPGAGARQGGLLAKVAIAGQGEGGDADDTLAVRYFLLFPMPGASLAGNPFARFLVQVGYGTGAWPLHGHLDLQR